MSDLNEVQNPTFYRVRIKDGHSTVGTLTQYAMELDGSPFGLLDMQKVADADAAAEAKAKTEAKS